MPLSLTAPVDGLTSWTLTDTGLLIATGVGPDCYRALGERGEQRKREGYMLDIIIGCCDHIEDDEEWVVVAFIAREEEEHEITVTAIGVSCL